MSEKVTRQISTEKGALIPAVGLGCYKARGREAVQAVCFAAEAGYRLFDTAARYENEREVGQGLRQSGLSRESSYVVTKIWPTDFEKPRQALESSLRELKLDYIDCWLLHWPTANTALRHRAYEAALKAKQQGLCRSVGVSNFLPVHLKALLAEFDEAPVMNQIELNPWFLQRETDAFCKAHGILISAWGPLLRGHLEEAALLQQLAEAHSRTSAQIALRWQLQKGHLIVPKSTSRARIFENIALFDFALSEEEMQLIDALETGRHTGGDPLTYSGDDFVRQNRREETL